MSAYQPLKAAAWMMGAVVSFTAMAVAGREVAHELDTFEIMTYRSLLGIAIVLAVGKWAGTLHEINRQQMGLHVLRNASHFAGQNLWFYALTLITLPQLFAFEFTVPLWVALFAPIFLAEKLTLGRVAASTIGFIGILIVARPDRVGLTPGIIAAAISAIAFAGTGIATKILTRRQSRTCILFWLTVLQALFGIVTAGFDGDIAVPSLAATPWIVLIGLAGLLAHFSITTALQMAPAMFVFPFDFLRLPLAATIGIVFYAEPFEVAVFVGAAIILLANFLNIRAEQQRVRQA